MERVHIGCDIVSLIRFRNIISRTPAMRRRIFLPQETKGASIEKLAGIFAAKEAAAKALDLSPGRWHDLEIMYEKNGKPSISFKDKTLRTSFDSDLSISHDGDYAVAFVAIWRKKIKKL